MDIQAQNTATYSYFSSRMCSDGYSNPERCDVFLFFATDALIDIQVQNTATIC
jgi:hypothetical protein